MTRRPWDVAFSAEPEEVAALRRVLRLHLGLWGLHHVIDAAQLCMSELVSNVITHVGRGTPATLVVCMSDSHLRIEVHDPDLRALPVLIEAGIESESGRGMALVGAVADRWGVRLDADRKVTWCELATGLGSPGGHVEDARLTRAEALLGHYIPAKLPRDPQLTRLSKGLAEEAVIDIVTDVLHWLRAHGCDTDDVLDRAQTHFEAQTEEGEDSASQGLR
jgi:anti-sigma regulatory factor (Ser/Thr protein kinase)